MQLANNPARAQRFSESGFVWEEKVSGATGAIEVPKYATLRVRASAGTTVTIDGILAATMAAGEIMFFNAGGGDFSDTKETVTITIGVASAYVQVARQIERKNI